MAAGPKGGGRKPDGRTQTGVTPCDGAEANVATDSMGDQPIETITLNGESLRLEYTQSQIVPAVLTLTPDGENRAVEVEMDFPDGMFFVSTTATRTESGKPPEGSSGTARDPHSAILLG